MNRMTTDNPRNDYETMLNLAYAENRKVHIRDMNQSFMQYIGKQCCKRGCNRYEMDDEGISITVTECAFSDPECPIFLLHMVATQAAELRARLKQYEDTGLAPEEVAALAKAKADGLLLELPCKIGDTVYAIEKCGSVHMSRDDDYFTGTGAVECPFESSCNIEECNDDNIRIFETAVTGFYQGVEKERQIEIFVDYLNPPISINDFGKTVFLTRKEAEAALKGENNG